MTAMQEDFWEQNADQWNQVTEAGQFKGRKVTNAAIVNEIRRRKIRTLLDVGCGEGWIAGALDLREIDYLGIDGAKTFIQIAQSKHKAAFENVNYKELVSQSWNPGKKFDGILFNFSLMDEEVSDLLRAAVLLLKPGGVLLIQTLHPCFALCDYRNGWNTEDFKTSGIEFSGKISWYGRTLATWIQLFENIGLKIKEVVEPLYEGKPASIIFVLGCEVCE
jgi:2-polyprenyl-3-methyl-5-hydroxy-6-metoxy-1,4-benzoquinol methylase